LYLCAESITATTIASETKSPGAVREGIKKAAMEEKLTGFIEMSDLRQSDHGPGRFALCIRGTGSASGPRRTYAVFFENEDYKGVRMTAKSRITAP
jgi:hypothetical protein